MFDKMSFIVGIMAGTLSTVSFIPQVVKICRTKNAKDLSITAFSVFAVSIVLWLTYGIMIGELPIIIANSVSLGLIVSIVILKIKYS